MMGDVQTRHIRTKRTLTVHAGDDQTDRSRNASPKARTPNVPIIASYTCAIAILTARPNTTEAQKGQEDRNLDREIFTKKSQKHRTELPENLEKTSKNLTAQKAVFS